MIGDPVRRVAATLERYAMLPESRRLAVAVSGGADSVFLLHALAELGLASAILHINHELRGIESDADEAFVRHLAARQNLPVHVLRAPVPAGNIEQEARRVRYEFFAAHGSVATGHTLDDQAETVLYRFLRGSGTAGLSGIRPVTGSIVRPLIEMRREEIRAWLRERNIPWREDESNANPEFLRNRIRLQHMPELAASMNPSLPEVLASTAAWARGEEEYWTAELDRLEGRFFTFGPEIALAATKPFLELPAAVQRRLLRRAIERVRGSLRSIDFRHVEGIRALMASAEGSGRVQLPGLDIYRSFDWLRLAPPAFDARVERDFEMPVAIPGRTENIERHWSIEIELVDRVPVYTKVVCGLDWDQCAGSLLLRNWRPGDQYESRDRSGAEKIKTLFQEYRIPLWERRTWPVIAQGNAILWTRRFGVAKAFAAHPGSHRILSIRELKEVRESNPARSASMELKRAPVRQPVGPGAEVL